MHMSSTLEHWPRCVWTYGHESLQKVGIRLASEHPRVGIRIGHLAKEILDIWYFLKFNLGFGHFGKLPKLLDLTKKIGRPVFLLLFSKKILDVWYFTWVLDILESCQKLPDLTKVQDIDVWDF